MDLFAIICVMALGIVGQIASLWAIQKGGLSKQLGVILWIKKLALVVLLLSGGILVLMPHPPPILTLILFASSGAWFIFMLIFWTMWIASKKEPSSH
jgi:hypothetical protein